MYNFQGTCNLWIIPVKLADVVVTQSILQKSGYTDSVLSLEKSVSLDYLQGMPSI